VAFDLPEIVGTYTQPLTPLIDLNQRKAEARRTPGFSISTRVRIEVQTQVICFEYFMTLSGGGGIHHAAHNAVGQLNAGEVSSGPDPSLLSV
jgi:hypothetical protein